MSTFPSLPAGDISTTLAVKYRPRRFSELSGQRHVITILKGAIRERKVPQQILFSGGSGIGKTTIARVLASSLLCLTTQDERDDFEPCGICRSCLLALDSKQSHPDLIEFDAASNGGKDEIREIANKAQYAPVLSEIKVYIIDEAHGLSGPGGQAFLKLLEEPPSHVIFMLCTTDPDKMLKTNRGRCVEFHLFKPTLEESLLNLRRITESEGWSISDFYLKEIISSSDSELGLRGQVSNLAKLSGVLSLGQSIDEDLLAHLLGTVSQNKIKLLFKYVEEQNPLSALDSLTQMRSFTDESFLRPALVRYAKELWYSEMNSPGKSTLTFEIYRKLVEMPKGEGWLELTIAQIARPELAPSNISAEEFQKYSTDILDKLNTSLSEAIKVSAELSNKTSYEGGRTESRTSKSVKKQTQKISSTRVGPGKVANKEDVPALFDDPNDVIRLIMACSPAPSELGSILNKCKVNFYEQRCNILVPVSLKDQFRAIEEYVIKGCQRLGKELNSAFETN